MKDRRMYKLVTLDSIPVYQHAAMKKIFFVILTAISINAFSQTDDDAVKQVINSAYVGGIHNGGPIDDIRKGFHPSFIMFVKNNNDVKTTTIEEWIGNLEKSRQAGAAKPA